VNLAPERGVRRLASDVPPLPGLAGTIGFPTAYAVGYFLNFLTPSGLKMRLSVAVRSDTGADLHRIRELATFMSRTCGQIRCEAAAKARL
jgi:hypothetical protein